MPISPERNDINVSKLFNWGKEVKIQDTNGKDIMKVFLRIVGDAELNRARVYALRKSAEFRKQLKDKDSDEHYAYIPDKDMIEQDKIVDLFLLAKTKDLYQDIVKDINVPFPKELDSDATLEQQERYQAEVDNYPNKLREAIEEQVNKKLEDEKRRLTKLSPSELYKLYVDQTVNDLCQSEMFVKFTDMCVFFASYKDNKYKTRLFGVVEEFQALPKEIKDQFIEAYSSLEINIEDLKKSPGVTP